MKRDDRLYLLGLLKRVSWALYMAGRTRQPWDDIRPERETEIRANAMDLHLEVNRATRSPPIAKRRR